LCCVSSWYLVFEEREKPLTLGNSQKR
jgi:hypothetical protein